MLFKSSSVPTQYNSHMDQNDSCVSNSGDVVIVVPAIMDNIRGPSIRSDHSHRICIEPDVDVEPTSPKTITESSSKLK